MKIRVYYHDTDCGGVVYYANYLKYLEEARTHYFEDRGVPVKKLMKEGIHFIVVRQEVDYKHPARYGDMLDIETKITEIGKSKVIFEYNIVNQDGKEIVSAVSKMATVGKDLKPMGIPEDIRAKIQNSKIKMQNDRSKSKNEEF